MGITFSLLLSAAGAILIWAVNTTSSGFNIHTAGVILLVVGIIGFVLSLAFWTTWGGFGGAGRGTAATRIRRSSASRRPFSGHTRPGSGPGPAAVGVRQTA